MPMPILDTEDDDEADKLKRVLFARHTFFDFGPPFDYQPQPPLSPTQSGRQTSDKDESRRFSGSLLSICNGQRQLARSRKTGLLRWSAA